jgi:predicted nucleic-acid-binding protein
VEAVDTNIVIRYLTQDNPKQGKKAARFIENGQPKFLSHVVLIEVVWVLNSCYRIDRAAITDALNELINSSFFVLDKPDIAEKAMVGYCAGFDFADMLIGYSGEANACHATYTFDKKAGQHPVFAFLE